MKLKLALLLSGALACLCACVSQKEKMGGAMNNPSERGFTFKTRKLEVVIKDGVIAGLKNLKTGEIIADPTLNDFSAPRGLGCISNDIPAMRKLHVPWGTTLLKQHQECGAAQPNLRHPVAKSKYEFTENDGVVKATWIGLSNGKRFYPDSRLSIEVWEDANTGSLCFRSSGEAADGGVFGVQIPLININLNNKFYLPHFGGMMFDKKISNALRGYGGAPFYEAPVVGVESPKGSWSMWKQDNQFYPYYAFFNKSDQSFAFAFEHQNLMPFETLKAITSPIWRLDVAEGGWTDAMSPFKDWYWHEFAAELKIRNSIDWAKNIRVIIDMFQADAATLRDVAETLDPETVMFQFWNARAPKFDQELPDWTPRKGYVENVKRIHDFGMKTMAYVNTYCVNYNSPVFKRDNVKDKFLTRKSSIWKYDAEKVSSPDSMNDMLLGTLQGKDKKDPFAGVKDGRLLYGDPLSAKWRKYHAEMMKWWNTTTGTDANYEDTAGCTGDFGNGVVDDIFAGQGSVAMMRDMLKTQPNVPMASEYGPAPIGFAVTWPLVYAQVWGNDQFREWRMDRQYPVSAYLYENRPWVPIIRADSDFLAQVVTSSSDSIGGFGMMSAHHSSLNANKGFLGHLKWRSQIFSRRRLKPYFTREKLEQGVRCLYKDFEDRLYKYRSADGAQEMIGPDGKALYARLNSRSEYTNPDLFLPGWPAQSDGKIFGLNPKERYALFPGVPYATAVNVKSMPTELAVTRYYEDKNFAVLNLAARGDRKKAEIVLSYDKKFKNISINGREIAPTKNQELTVSVDLPAYILFSSYVNVAKYDAPIANSDTPTRLVNAKGLMESSEPGKLSKLHSGTFKIDGKHIRSLMLVGGGTCENTLDCLTRIPAADSSLKVSVKNKSNKYGDGSIAKVYINGKLVKEFDCVSDKKFDTQVHEWIIPLGRYAGQNALISLATNHKKGTNCDNQWFSMPSLVKDPDQKLKERVIEK